ncbi:MAG: hypothetical protein IKK08_00660 [Clostridia bacterium]|nr:hypothetical protein [Clostridia bacterium]
MKKMIMMILALVLAAAVPMAAFAEDVAEPLPPFEGLVTEVFEGGFLMEDIQMGMLQINTDENTVLDGILSQLPIEVGMYVLVDHNGMMTRSIPPQVYGIRVGCYTLSGVAGEITEEGVLLTGDPIFGDAFVQMPADMAIVFPGAPMLVYYDGIMTMSLPGKVNARYVVVPQLTGVISEKDGAGFTLTDENGNAYRVLTSDSMFVGLLPEEETQLTEDTVSVDEAIASAEALVEEVVSGEAADAGVPAEENTEELPTPALPAEGDADAGVPAEENTEELPTPALPAEGDADAGVPAEENTEELPTPALPAEGAVADDWINWDNGDTVTVYHQGPMDAEPAAEGEPLTEVIALGLLKH